MLLNNMNSDEKKDWIETFVGGACGVIAIFAAIIEFVLGDNGALAGMFKDIFGTAVVVVLLFAAMPKRKPKNLARILEQTVEEWGENNAPLIFKAEEYTRAQNSKNTQGFRLLQNPKEDYIPLVTQNITKGTSEWTRYAKYGSGNHLTGKFIDMPSYADMISNDFKLTICLEQSHFRNMSEIDKIIVNIVSAIQTCGKAKVNARRVGSSHTIELSCTQVNSYEDIKEFVEMLDFVLSLVKVIV